MRSWRTTAALLMFAGASLLVALIGWNGGMGPIAGAQTPVQVPAQQLSKVEDLSAVFHTIGKAVQPSVVQIEVEKTVKSPHGDGEEQFHRFFHNPDNNQDNANPDDNNDSGNGDDNSDQGDEQMVGTGSGVIIEADAKTGYILTNNHVAGGATVMKITLADGRVINKAKVLGADPKSDLAVVRIEAEGLTSARWGDSDALEQGDWVLAFGSPFGFIGSMTHGIVSALHRQADLLGKQGYENFIQVDAPINPGNSGGPLVNIHGEVVGINTAIASQDGGFQGIGFAIPSNQARAVYNSLKEHGKVVRGWLGVSIFDVASLPQLAQSFGFNGHQGVLVEQTFEGTPAYGKLYRGDIITGINGKLVHDAEELREMVAAAAPGSELTLQVFRHGKTDDVTVKIGEQPENLDNLGRGNHPAPPMPNEEVAVANLGIGLRTFDSDLAAHFGMQDQNIKSGAVVMRVDHNSLAAQDDLRVGDVITEVGDHEVHSAKEAADALNAVDFKKGIRLYVVSRDGARYAFIQSGALEQ